MKKTLIILGILVLIAVTAAIYNSTRTEVAGPLPVAPSVSEEQNALPSIVLEKDGLGAVKFGSSPEATIAALSTVLGTPTKDTGVMSSFSGYGTCPGNTVRGVEWNNLYVLFGDTGYGKNAFYQYGYTDKPPLGFAFETNKGVSLGMSPAEIKALYPNAKFSEWLPEQDGVLLEARDPNSRNDFLGGTFIDDKLYFIIGGIQCGE